MGAMDFSQAEFDLRIRRLREVMGNFCVDLMIIDDPEMLAYFTGYDRSLTSYRAGFIPREGEPVVVLRALDVAPFRERSWIKHRVGYKDAADPLGIIADVIIAEGYGSGTIGFDGGSHAMTIATLRTLKARLPDAEFTDLEGTPWDLRLIKSAAEIAYLRRAGEIASAVMAEVVDIAGVGATERQVSAFISARCIEMGADPGLISIVSKGAGWGFLHGHLHDTPLQVGDIVHVELVPRVKGYSARLMRSVVVGQPSREQVELFDLLVQAQDGQIAAMLPGAMARDVDAVVRRRLLESGARQTYDNVTGYTVGYYSNYSTRSSDFSRVFSPSADWTLEPGLAFHMYVSADGLAISETILVTEHRPEILTRFDRTLLVNSSSR